MREFRVHRVAMCEHIIRSRHTLDFSQCGQRTDTHRKVRFILP